MAKYSSKLLLLITRQADHLPDKLVVLSERVKNRTLVLGGIIGCVWQDNTRKRYPKERSNQFIKQKRRGTEFKIRGLEIWKSWLFLEPDGKQWYLTRLWGGWGWARGKPLSWFIRLKENIVQDVVFPSTPNSLMSVATMKGERRRHGGKEAKK